MFDVPVGYNITVEPKPDANTIDRFDYSPTVVITNGGTSVEGNTQTTVLEKELAYVFTNTYTLQRTSLTINTSLTDGTKAEQGSTIIYRIRGDPDDKLTQHIDLTVSAKSNNEGFDSVKINDLPVGEYTVTEDKSWAWRYTPGSVVFNSGTQTVTDNGVTITLPKNKKCWRKKKGSKKIRNQ